MLEVVTSITRMVSVWSLKQLETDDEYARTVTVTLSLSAEIGVNVATAEAAPWDNPATKNS